MAMRVTGTYENTTVGGETVRAFIPPQALPEALASLECWLRENDPLPPLVRVGLAHMCNSKPFIHSLTETDVLAVL